MTTDSTTRTITLSNRRPVKIREADWPMLARGAWHDWDNQYEFQANRTWKAFVHVRQHQDGRALVYGGYDYDTAFQNEQDLAYRAGELLTPDPHAGVTTQAIVAAIHRVAEDLGARSNQGEHFRDIADNCIADLPAEEL
jgi:hypothetical protein